MVVYVNWDERKIVSEDRFDEMVENEVCARDTRDALDAYLDKNYKASEVYAMAQDGEEALLHGEFVDTLFDEVETELATEWEDAEVELAVGEDEDEDDDLDAEDDAEDDAE